MTIKNFISDIESFAGKTIAITGATSGIGRQLFYHLMSKHASIVLLSRNIEKATKLKNEFPEENVDIIYYDQASNKSIESGCDELIKKYPKLYAIVLDAGVLGVQTSTKDGYPGTIGVNYLGARHFIDYISPKLTNRVRFVIQGSIVGGLNPRKNADIYDTKLGTFAQYNLSKIYLEAYFYKLIKSKKYPEIEYVLTEPGISSTGIISNFNAFIRVAGKYFLKLFFHSPKKASLTMLVGLTSKAKSGDYIIPRGLFSMSGYPKIKKFPEKRRREYLFGTKAK